MPSLVLPLVAAVALSPGAAPLPTSLRLLEWNVSDSAWVKHREATRAVLRYADPDVLVLVQVASGLGDADIRGMLDGLRGPSDTTWFITSRVAGDHERTVIAGRDSVRPLGEFSRVAYPDTGAAAARAAVPTDGSVPARDRVENVRTNGAMVRVVDRWLFVVGVHLTCCGTPDSWREARRRLAATLVRQRMEVTFSREAPSGLVVAGDMNLVAGRAPMDTLLATHTPAPLGALRRADAVHPDGWTDWTWDGRGTPFNGGRLDNVLYSAASLEAVRSRVWDTQFMDGDTLAAHGLTSATSASIGRHRPVVVDLRFRR